MTTKDIEKSVAGIADSLLGPDRMMMKKRVTVEDSFYRKDDPDRILWRGAWSAEVNVCVIAICAVVFLAGAAVAARGLTSKMRKKMRG